jgi:hypothetical protein
MSKPVVTPSAARSRAFARTTALGRVPRDPRLQAVRRNSPSQAASPPRRRQERMSSVRTSAIPDRCSVGYLRGRVAGFGADGDDHLAAGDLDV